METLQRQIKRASVRCLVQSAIGKLGICWFATLLVALPILGAFKYWPLADRQLEQTWILSILAGALALGLVAAGVWTWLTRQSMLDVATEIDRRFALKERVSSTLALSDDQRQSQIGQALVEDAVRRVERIDVPTHFGLHFDRRSLLPLVPAGLAAALVVFVPGRLPPEVPKPAVQEAAQTENSVKALAKRLDEKMKEAHEAGLEEADPVLEQLLQGAKELAEKAPADRKQALVALNDLVKDAEKRRQELAGNKEIQQQLNQMKQLQQGPAQKMANALKNGDLKKAMDELKQLEDKLKGDGLNQQEKEQLAGQLEQMQQAMEKMVESQKQAQEEIKQQIEQERRAGNTDAADKLQQKLDKMQDKAEQMGRMGDMAKQLKQASESLKNGDPQQAAEALEQMGEQLAEMDQENDELAMLDDAMDQVNECKNGMNCKECNGQGCEECQGGKDGQMGGPKDFAKGQGQGAGKRDRQETEAGFIDSHVRQNVGKGAMKVTGTADGPNKKGTVQQMIKEGSSTAPQQAAEALTDQRLPHDYRDHAKGYFEALREGQPQAPANP